MSVSYLIDDSWQLTIPAVLVVGSSAILGSVLVRHPRMFVKSHGRVHRITGLLFLIWIGLGFVQVFSNLSIVGSSLLYDTVLGIIGTSLALSAAFEFKHKNVRNIASGTLDEHATVTYGEMIEHSFYQGINLVQIVFLHCIAPHIPQIQRLSWALLATSPWLIRKYFPVNHFSDNYTKIDEKSTDFIRLLYRIKKYQYVFYKHFLLHGLNLSVALYGYSIAQDRIFRLYWLLLNTSYVLEFFLQSLVKKRHMSQCTMLYLQHLLMSASSFAAVSVLQLVDLRLAVASMLLNFVNRQQDMMNMVTLLEYAAVLEMLK
jgi:hypothetical protein